MRDRRRPGAHISHERWLVSYADFVTLLFAFFVVLYASAQIDKKKAVNLSNAIEAAFQQLGAFQSDTPKSGRTAPNGTLPAAAASSDDPTGQLSQLASSDPGLLEVNRKAEDFRALRAELEKALAAEIKRNEVALHMDADGLVVSLREVGFFDSGSATIKPGAEGAFSRVALILQAHSCAMRIEGHTDTVPIHTSQYASNWELSTARATEMVKSLIEDHGVSPGRLSAAGYAEFHPVAGNDTVKGRQLNRRVDIVILAVPARGSAIAHPDPRPLLHDPGGEGAISGRETHPTSGGHAG
ncbi:MAG: flagellar motor protein MotB [Candidatus Korobacteraceae bacterium]